MHKPLGIISLFHHLSSVLLGLPYKFIINREFKFVKHLLEIYFRWVFELYFFDVAKNAKNMIAVIKQLRYNCNEVIA